MGMSRRNPVVMCRWQGYQRPRHPGRDNMGPGTIVSVSPVPSSLIRTPPVSSVKKDRHPDIGYRVYIGPRDHSHGWRRVEDICRGAGVDADIQIYHCASRRCNGACGECNSNHYCHDRYACFHVFLSFRLCARCFRIHLMHKLRLLSCPYRQKEGVGGLMRDFSCWIGRVVL